MTKVLFWNVDRYNVRNFVSDSDVEDTATRVSFKNMAASRRDVLRATIAAANPEIFVMVEVQAAPSSTSDLPTDNGGLSGLVWLLGELRAGWTGFTGSAEWRLVPPLVISGPSNAGPETLAIFYLGVTGTGTTAVRRYFTGPNVWSGGSSGKSVRTGTPAPYAGVSTRGARNVITTIPIDPFLVPPTTSARDIPTTALYNAGLKENVVAARKQFYQSPPATAATAKGYATAKPPVMATFSEVAGTTTRNLTLFVAHAPASLLATGFIADLADTLEFSEDLKANETRLLVGDFNTNLMKPDATLNDAYAPLTAISYSLLLKPADTPPTTDLEIYKGFFATTLGSPWAGRPEARRDFKLLWSASTTDLSYYPAYGYAPPSPPSPRLPLYSLDNMLVRPRVSSQDYRMTILNFVVGSPLNRVTPPTGAPPGTLAIAKGLSDTSTPTAPEAAVFDLTWANAAEAWNEYGRLRGTSDHFGIYAEV